VLLRGTWFDQAFRDLIQSTFSPPPPETRNYFNVAEAEASGLDLGAEGRRGSLSIVGSYTWLRASVVDAGLASGASFAEGEALLRRPEHSGNLGVRYRSGDLGVALQANLVGERADVDFGVFPEARVTLDPYATFGVSAEKGLPLAGGLETTLLFSVGNLLDAEYEEVLGYASPGRTIRLGARVRTGG
jgi:vitamin B12 transporter